MIMMPYAWTLDIAAAHRSGRPLAPHTIKSNTQPTCHQGKLVKPATRSASQNHDQLKLRLACSRCGLQMACTTAYRPVRIQRLTRRLSGLAQFAGDSPGGPTVVEATGPVRLLRGALEHAAGLVFAQALPPEVRFSLDNSQSYAHWLGQRPA